jgi:hypothetical protein
MQDIEPKKMKVQGMGIVLCNLMELGKIDTVELKSIVSLLQ